MDGNGGGRGGAPRVDLETARAAGFGRITRLVTQLLGVPAAYVTFAEGDSLHFRGHEGRPAGPAAGTVPLAEALCRHVAAAGAMVALEDAGPYLSAPAGPEDAPPSIGAYIGVPVVGAAGEEGLCVLCAVDERPRAWTAAERRIMSELAEMLRTELDLRADIREHEGERRRTLLMVREMEHRVKNSLATVQAMIAMSLKGQPVAEQIRRGLLERIAALARTHTLLLEGEGTSTTFEALLDAELAHYGVGEAIRLEGPSVRLAGTEAVAVGMVLHELATNAVKYGALSGGDGRLDVVWSERNASPDGRILRFEWLERRTGGTLPARGADGFGTTLLDALIVHQQGGSIERRWEAGGLALVAEMGLSGG